MTTFIPRYRPDSPIITSLLDTDIYQYYVLYFLYCCFENPAAPIYLGKELKEPQVQYALTNRPNKVGEKVPLADHVSPAELREHLDHIQKLRLSDQELVYLEQLFIKLGQPQVLVSGFVQFLKHLTLSEYHLELTPDTQFDLRVTGHWHQALLWETMAMASLTELLTQHLAEDQFKAVFTEGNARLASNIELIKRNSGFTLAEFGNRRRASKEWQAFVLEELVKGVGLVSAGGALSGTSTVQLAKDLQVPAIGTMPHQVFMVFAALYWEEDEKVGYFRSQEIITQKWWQLFGKPLSLFLPDTFTSPAFMAHFDPEIARQAKGFRQDSGNANHFMSDCILPYYRQKCGLSDEEIKTKVCVFSDSLQLPQAIELWTTWREVITPTIGIGGGIINDLGPAFPKPSIVMKPELVFTANGSVWPAMKLSDDPGKVTGSKNNDTEKRFRNLAT